MGGGTQQLEVWPHTAMRARECTLMPAFLTRLDYTRQDTVRCASADAVLARIIRAILSCPPVPHEVQRSVITEPSPAAPLLLLLPLLRQTVQENPERLLLPPAPLLRPSPHRPRPLPGHGPICKKSASPPGDGSSRWALRATPLRGTGTSLPGGAERLVELQLKLELVLELEFVATRGRL